MGRRFNFNPRLRFSCYSGKIFKVKFEILVNCNFLKKKEKLFIVFVSPKGTILGDGHSLE